MAKIENLVEETSTSTGTGNFTLANKDARQGFSDAFGTSGSDVFWYFILHRTADEWEVGTGSMSDATTLVRDTVLASSNSGSAVNFSSGTKDITNDVPFTYQPPSYQSDTQPSTVVDGTRWTRTTDGKKFELYDDGTTTQWIQVTSGGGALVNAYEINNGLTYPINCGLTASAGSGVLTVTLTGANGSALSSTNRARIPFRNVTETDGSITWIDQSSAATLTLTSGADLGQDIDHAFRVWIVAFNDGGTLQLAAWTSTANGSLNIAPLTPWGVASSTAESASADSAGVFYTESGVTVSSKAFTVLGFLEWNATGIATTAGVWTTTNLQRIQMFGPGVPLPGTPVQHIIVQDATEASSATSSPAIDNTIPQSSEGNQYLTQAVTPTSAANRLDVSFDTYGSGGLASAVITLALFQDSTADALAAQGFSVPVANYLFKMRLEHSFKAQTSSSTTLKIRFGANANTGYLLRTGVGGSYYSQTDVSVFQIKEVMT